MRENTDKNNSEFGQFSRSVVFCEKRVFWKFEDKKSAINLLAIFRKIPVNLELKFNEVADLETVTLLKITNPFTSFF